jgi:plastocyanin
MRRLVLSLAVTLALGGGVALAQYPEPPTPAPATAAPAASTAPAPAPAPSTISVVHIKDFKFVPDTLTIHAGQTVRFIQDDDTPHTVTASDRSYDSGNLDKGKPWTHTFAKEGTYQYVCTYHPYMKGSVVVK